MTAFDTDVKPCHIGFQIDAPAMSGQTREAGPMPLDPILYDPAADATLEDFLAWSLQKVMAMNGAPIRSEYLHDEGLYWQHKRQWEQAQHALKAYEERQPDAARQTNDAVLDERRACADVAKEYAKQGDWNVETAEAIEHTIRNRTESID